MPSKAHFPAPIFSISPTLSRFWHCITLILLCDIINEENGAGVPKKGFDDGSKSLLASCVPNLHFDLCVSIYIHFFSDKLRSCVNPYLPIVFWELSLNSPFTYLLMSELFPVAGSPMSTILKTGSWGLFFRSDVLCIVFVKIYQSNHPRALLMHRSFFLSSDSSFLRNTIIACIEHSITL